VDDLYIFYHLPKCGGTTLSRIIDKLYDPSVLFVVNPAMQHFHASLRELRQLNPDAISKLRMIRGHQTYGLDKIFGRSCKYITILREPAHRFVSAYFHAIHDPDLPLGRRLRDSGITLQQLAEADDAALGRDYLVRSFAAVPEAAHAREGADFLELAKNNLSRDFIAVGITERMHESVLLISERLHWKIRGYRSHNVSREYSIDQVNSEVLTAFRQRNPSDVAFYEFALSLWDRQTQAIPSFAEKLEHFCSTNRTYNQWHDRIDKLKKPLRPVHRLLMGKTAGMS
jgi:hypothetical protein